MKRKIKLDGANWRAQYFRPSRPLIEKETAIDNLMLPDGETAGAATETYDDRSWFPAVVPVDVRDLLVRHGVISDPYWGRNSDATRWVMDYEWWFRKRFRTPAGGGQDQRIRLVFQGVDLLADYFLNGQKLGSSNDMFVPQSFEITSLVHPDRENLLAVRLRPQRACTANHYWAGEIPNRAHYHKAQVSWGWDWAREMVSMGIWDSVWLETAETVFINDLWVEARPKGETDADLRVRVSFNTQVAFTGQATLAVWSEQTGQRIAKIEQEVSGRPGDNDWAVALPLRQVQYWYPNGYGQQPLYRVRLSFHRQVRELTSTETIFGIRAIRMQRNPAAPPDAYNLIFNVNGTRVFALGANWVPADLLFARLNPRRYDTLVRQAAAIGFNMLRVWGGGLIEKDAFYEACDRYGLLVWQEFPLACANYPKDKNFVREKEREAEAVLRKLRNHPCLALYCGGNELFYYGETSRSPVLKIFKRKVAELHPTIDYHYSSPDKEREGERNHGPWHYQPHHHAFWNQHFRTFASELGCNAAPAYRSFRRFLDPADIATRAPTLLHHFIDLAGISHHSYAGTQLFDCRTDADLVFASQFVQADTLAYLVGKYRACAWRSSGVLIWQYNSAWPEGQWSIIDYYGAPKLAAYFLREVCARQALHIQDDDWELHRADTLSFKVYFLGAPAARPNVQPVRWELRDERGRVRQHGGGPIRPGAKVAIELNRPATQFPSGFFCLRLSLAQPAGPPIVRNQFYACDCWKTVDLKHLQASVQKLVGGRPW